MQYDFSARMEIRDGFSNVWFARGAPSLSSRGGGRNFGEHLRQHRLGYDAFKLLGYVPPAFVVRNAAGHNWSTPSADGIRRGNGGIADGRRDKDIFDRNPDAQVR